MILFGNKNRTSYNPPSVVIGTQTWALANFAESTLVNGTVIPEVKNGTAWAALTSEAWCNYENSSANGVIYGKLYNSWAITLINNVYSLYGWRIPINSDFTTLIAYLGGASVAGGKMKEVGTTRWSAPNTGADNSSGFTALPGGLRAANGSFSNINIQARFYYYLTGVGRVQYLQNIGSSIDNTSANINNGHSLRLIKI